MLNLVFVRYFGFAKCQGLPWVPEVLSRHAFVRCRGRPKADNERRKYKRHRRRVI